MRIKCFRVLLVASMCAGVLKINAGCNSPNGPFELGDVSGDAYVGVSTTNTYSISAPVPGTYSWSIGSFTLHNCNGDEEDVELIAPASPSGSLNDQKIVVTFSPDAPGSGSCTATQKVTVCKIELAGPGSAIEGTDSDDFTVTCVPKNLNIEWTATTCSPPEAEEISYGNGPSVSFVTSPDKKVAYVKKCHWFACPDNRLISKAGPLCVYLIKASVSGGNNVSAESKFGVQVKIPVTSNPKIVGTPEVAEVSPGRWEVTGLGTVRRIGPEIDWNGMPETSQFRAKAKIHEERHIEQFTTGVAGVDACADLWDPQSAFDEMNDMDALYGGQKTCAPTEAGIIAAFQIFIDIANEASAQAALDRNYNQSELDAFRLSNAVSPHYLEADLDEIQAAIDANNAGGD